jgi:tetratricopeptide (TPR) repeat protein
LFEQAAVRDDVRPWTLYALGFTYVGLGRPRDAIAAWNRVREAAPDFQPVYLDLAAHHAQLSSESDAVSVLRAAERRWPADAEIQNGIGVLMVRRRAFDEAIDAFTKATAAAPSDALSWLNLGRAYELRYDRLLRYDAQLLKWVGPEGDRVKAKNSYERCVALGGPYATQASEALSRMAWSQ